MGQNVLVTGGAGFLGSSLVHRLTESGHQVTVIDNFHPDYGANEHNLSDVRGQLQVIRGDVIDRQVMHQLASEAELIFHIAGQGSHVDSMTNPWRDVEFNCLGTLSVLEAARQSPRKPAVVFSGTRAVIGAAAQLPATELVRPNPVDICSVDKLSAELYGAVYARAHRVPFVSLRLSSCFGPRHQMKNGKYGILNWFISQALQSRPIKVFGRGEQLRDYLYVDDAVDAFVKAGRFIVELAQGKRHSPKVQLAGAGIPFAVFNIASEIGMPFISCARKIAEITGCPVEMVPWPDDRRAIETGDYVADCGCAHEALDWKATVSFETGLEKTIAYYREQLRHYV